MTKKTILLVGVIVGLFALSGCFSATGKTQNPSAAVPKTDNVATNTQEVAKTQVVEIGEGPVFTAFSQQLYSELLGKKPFVIFFHASWCSTCVQLTKDINEDLANFPKGTVILEADFDTETKLKQDYGVLMQATLVVIDKTGNEVERLAAPSVEELKTAIAQTL